MTDANHLPLFEGSRGWNRFAPVPRNEYLDESLEGRLHDPLWMLSRQRQFHEFEASDAGTSVRVDADVQIDPFDAVELRGEDAAGKIPYDGGPLEPLVEREHVLLNGEPTPALKAEAGRRFCQLLEDEGFTDSVSPEAFDDDFLLEEFNDVMDERALDGSEVYDTLQTVVDLDWTEGTGADATAEWTGGDTDELPVPDDESIDTEDPDPEYEAAATAYCEWYAQQYDKPASKTGAAALGAEAGRQFCRLLEAEGFADSVSPEAFDDDFLLEEPDEAMPPDDRRFFDVMRGRALDGRMVYDTLRTVVDLDWNEGTGADTTAEWTGGDTDELPVPDDESIDTEDSDPDPEYEAAATAYCEWYAQLYDEPTPETGSAWRPTRLEYDAGLRVGSGSDAVLFDIDAYTGGRLEWEDFVATTGSPSTVSTNLESPEWPDKDVEKVPSAMRLPGMPTRRWWEFASDPVALEDIAADGTALPYVLALQYTLEYGGNWLRIGLDVPVSSYVRIEDMEITDSFGVVEEDVTPVDDGDEDGDADWQAFTTDVDHHEYPGLLVPPTIPWSDDSDPYEEVIFARDELANLAFGIEETAEGPTGRPVDRREFTPPTLEIRSVTPADDPDEEQVVLENVGDDEFSLAGHSLWRVDDNGNTDGNDTDDTDETDADDKNGTDDDDPPVYTFDDEVLAPGETVTVYTGTGPIDEHTAGKAPVWRTANAVDVTDEEGKLVVRKLLTRPDDVSGAYRLVTSVPDHWFPFTMEPDDEENLERRDLWYQDEYRLRRAVLLDADALDADFENIPQPMGELLDPDDRLLPEEEETLLLYEEEVTRSGRVGERLDHLVTWSDGSTFLWRGSDISPGRGELASGLRFDLLEDG